MFRRRAAATRPSAGGGPPPGGPRGAEPQQRPLQAEGVEQRAPVVQPGVGRAPAGRRGGLVAVRRVRWGRRAVVRDHRRFAVAGAEGDAGDVELGAAVPLEVLARLAAQLLASRAVVLEPGLRHEAAERLGEPARVAGVADGGRPALELVALEQLGAGDAADRGRELPPEVDRVLDRGVVAEAAGGREEVRRVAAEEDAAAPEALRNERVARRPRVAREDRRVDPGAGGGVEQAGGVGLARALRVLALAQLRMEGELALAVDG